MPNSTFSDNLVDSLVPVVDSIRSDLQDILGHRQYDVYLVIRAWDGGRVESGTASFVQEQLIDPQPAVMRRNAKGELVPCGFSETGNIVLTEVSLTYTESELFAPTLNAGEEFYYRITDAHGQGIRTRYYKPSAVPYPDRPGTNNIDPGDLGWVIELSSVSKVE